MYRNKVSNKDSKTKNLNDVGVGRMNRKKKVIIIYDKAKDLKRAKKCVLPNERMYKYHIAEKESNRQKDVYIKICSFMIGKGFSISGKVIGCGKFVVCSLAGFIGMTFARGIKTCIISTDNKRYAGFDINFGNTKNPVGRKSDRYLRVREEK